MTLKIGFYGVVLFFTVASAQALDMRSSQPVAPEPEAPKTAPVKPAPAATNERVRQFLNQSGVDPDSDNGRLLVAFLTRLATDAAYGDKFARYSRSGATFDGQLSPDERLRVLHLMKDLAQTQKGECDALSAKAGDFVLLAKTLPPRSFKDVMEMLEISVDHRNSDPDGERYTPAELLAAESELESAFEAKYTPSSTAQGKRNFCEDLSTMVDTIDAMPPVLRQRATYEFLQTISHKPSAQEKVLADPSAYLDDIFDERRLPEPVRRKLPENGSRRLPYARLVIDAEWRHQSKPDEPSPFRNIFVNRRNNGVIAELLTTGADAAPQSSADFDLSYGVADLMTQGVGPRLTPLGTLNDDAAIEVANQPLVEGRSLALPVPLPSEDGETARLCEVGKTVPASTVFRSLDGDAVELHCKIVKKDGNTEHVNLALLVNYGITWWTSYDNEHGHTDIVIKNVTVQQP